MTEQPYPAEQRLGADLGPVAAYQPPTYGQPRTGPGRWCVLYSQAGEQELGVLWTSDAGGLGFIPTTDAGAVRVADFYHAFSGAAGVGSPAAFVFSDYAARAGLGLSAGPVTTGDLDTLAD